MDMRLVLGMLEICIAGSLRAVAEEISKCNLDLVGVLKVRWDGATADEYTFFYGKRMKS
jgi:hypothetical protein